MANNASKGIAAGNTILSTAVFPIGAERILIAAS
jgi:hypothetical protein